MEHTLTFRCHSNPSGKHQLDAAGGGGRGRDWESGGQPRIGALRLSPRVPREISAAGPGRTPRPSPPGTSGGGGELELAGRFGTRPPNSCCSARLLAASVLGRAVCSRCSPSSCPAHASPPSCLSLAPLRCNCPRPHPGSSELLLGDSSLLPKACPASHGSPLPCPVWDASLSLPAGSWAPCGSRAPQGLSPRPLFPLCRLPALSSSGLGHHLALTTPPLLELRALSRASV